MRDAVVMWSRPALRFPAVALRLWVLSLLVIGTVAEDDLLLIRYCCPKPDEKCEYEPQLPEELFPITILTVCGCVFVTLFCCGQQCL